MLSEKQINTEDLKNLTTQVDEGARDFEHGCLDPAKASFGKRMGAGAGARTAGQLEDLPTSHDIYHGTRQE